MPRNHLDHSLLSKVLFRVEYSQRMNINHVFPEVDLNLCQVRELADEEMLHDTEIHFE
jgi:hypothetical protein